ncbi:arrestin [Ceratobasidium sp. AG-Ba]|nr:arrestin [Ceratobasidium sp. AG-Ba]
MVALSVVPVRGNAGARYFPHSGHLGLTPVKVEGVVRTRLEEDGKPMTASAVTISLRCYESRVGRVGVVKSNIILEQSQTLWSPPSDSVYGSLGAVDLPFKLVLPVNAAGNSTFNLQDYRIYWRVEAAMHHPHVPGVGTRQVKCFDVNLVRYNKPSTSTLPHPGPSSDIYPLSTQPVRCELAFPRQSVAPLDPVPVSLRIHSRPGTSVQRVTFALERRIDMFDATPSSQPQLPSPPATLTRKPSREGYLFPASESSVTVQSISSTAPLLPSPSRQERPSSSRKRSPSPASQLLAAKTIEAVLASVDVAEVPPSHGGLYTVNSALQVPLPKSSAHWGVGETMQGGLARVRFFVTAKVQLTIAGSDVVELCEQEINVVPVDDAERLRVHSKYSMKRPATSPSTTENQQEPRRPVPHLPSPPPSPSLGVPSRSGKASRRPHTASGARDASQRRALPLRPRSRGNEQPMSAAVFGPDQVRAWERELDKIAPVSAAATQRPRSSSALRIFSSRKQRSPPPEPRPEITVTSTIGVARAVVVPNARTAEVLEWEAEVERFSSASAREAVLRSHVNRAPLSV